MKNKKFISTVIIFWSFCLWITLHSLLSEKEGRKSFVKQAKKSDEYSFFKNVHYFKIQDGLPYLDLKADSLNIFNKVLLNFDSPRGLLISRNTEVTYNALAGEFDQRENFLSLSGGVELKSPEYTYESSQLSLDGKNEILSASGGVKAEILDSKTKDKLLLTANQLRSYLELKTIEIQGKVKGVINRLRRYEGKLNFRAEKVSIDQSSSKMGLEGQVQINRKSYNLSAGKAEIFLENFNKKLKYYVLYDDVKLIETVRLASGKKQTRRAYAEKLEAFQSKREVVLTGAPRVEQGPDIIKGYQITLRENVELVEIDDSQTSFRLKKEE